MDMLIDLDIATIQHMKVESRKVEPSLNPYSGINHLQVVLFMWI